MSKSVKSSAKILLADDSVTMHRAVSLGLKKEPFEVLYCDNGQDALRLTREHRPLIVLADLDMPGMTGAELCNVIKKDPDLSNDIKVILLCGSFDQIDEKEVEKIPADARLWKPFESHVLVSMINTLLKISPKQSAEATAQMSRPSSPTMNIQRPAEETEDISSDSLMPMADSMANAATSQFKAPEIDSPNEPTAQMPFQTPPPRTPPLPPPPPPIAQSRTPEMTAPLKNEDVIRDNLWSSDYDQMETGSNIREKTTEEKQPNFAQEGEDSEFGPDFELVGTPKSIASHVSNFMDPPPAQAKENTESFEGFASDNSSPGNIAGFNENDVREIVREEIQKAFNSYLKDGLERRLRDVISQIEKSSKS
ncbi:response regulator [bacterium]|nr:response regulator [bacterium]